MTAAKDRGAAGALHVKVVQHGGFAGVPIAHEMDTTSLTPERARRLRALARASGLLEGTPDVVARRFPQGRDLIEWEVTATEGGSSRTARCTEDALGPSLSRLIATGRARP